MKHALLLLAVLCITACGKPGETPSASTAAPAPNQTSSGVFCGETLYWNEGLCVEAMPSGQFIPLADGTYTVGSCQFTVSGGVPKL